MIEQGNLSLPVYERIKEMILDGTLKPGEKIRQEHLAAELGVSRTPLLKAFQMLENEMLVESVPRRGMFVKEIDLTEILDAFECREVLEGVAARRAAKNITTEEISDLKALFEPFKGNSDDDVIAYQEADHIFHKKLIAISENTVLNRLDIFSNLLISTYQRGLIRGTVETLKEHYDIIEALEKGDEKESERLARLHLAKSEESIIRIIESEKE